MLATKLPINMPHLLVNLSTSLDFTQQGITDHHKRVAIIALRLAQAAGFNSEQQLLPVFQSSIIHDIGAISWEEKSCLTSFDLETPHQHCINGSNLVARTKTLSAIDTIIRCHHDHWLGTNTSGLSKNAIPLTSRIIHLADRLDILIRPGLHILEQRENILSRLQAGSGTTFDPNLVELLVTISRAESFWLELASPWLDESLTALPLWQPANIGIDDLYDLANLFAGVIDYKSPFTHRHSHGVSMVASLLAKRVGLSQAETDFVTIAALLHDIGKLSVPDKVLEKPGSLSVSEMYWIKQHTYFTFKILQPLSPSTLIPQWAAYHHEKLNGHGYPFGYSAYQLDLPSRIIAIADIFSALREDRPYRAGLAWNEIEPILTKEVDQGSIDPDLCLLLLEIRQDIDNHWEDLSNGK
ncbi:MAG: HD-GYP domain-containing protein [Methylocystaceae bacterium]